MIGETMLPFHDFQEETFRKLAMLFHIFLNILHNVLNVQVLPLYYDMQYIKLLIFVYVVDRLHLILHSINFRLHRLGFYCCERNYSQQLKRPWNVVKLLRDPRFENIHNIYSNGNKLNYHLSLLLNQHSKHPARMIMPFPYHQVFYGS